MVRLVAAVPPPRAHLLKYFGVLSSHSSLRREVVPKPPPDPTQRRPPLAAGDQLELPVMRRPQRRSPQAPPMGLADPRTYSAQTSTAVPDAAAQCDGSRRLRLPRTLSGSWPSSGSARSRLLHPDRHRPASSPCRSGEVRHRWPASRLPTRRTTALRSSDPAICRPLAPAPLSRSADCRFVPARTAPAQRRVHSAPGRFAASFFLCVPAVRRNFFLITFLQVAVLSPRRTSFSRQRASDNLVAGSAARVVPLRWGSPSRSRLANVSRESFGPLNPRMV